MKRQHPPFISAADLPDEYTIKNPRTFISNYRGTFLKSARKHYCFTVQQVVEKIGINASTLNRIESGKVTEQDIMHLCDLSELYKLDCYYVLAAFKLAESRESESYGLAALGANGIDKNSKENISNLINLIKAI